MPDALRLALGTLTAVRVPPPRAVTPRTAGRALLLAPAVGVVLALLACALPDLVGLAAPDRRTTPSADLLLAALAVGALALLTRGLHLDGLADTADGLGVKGIDADVRARRLDVMRAPDVGAFGVAAVVLALLLQASALAVAWGAGAGTGALVLACATGRLAATWCCVRGVAAARPDGLGAAVAGSVGRGAAGALALVCLVGAGLLGAGVAGPAGAVAAPAALAVGVAAGLVVLRTCLRRLGGVTGDVLGAVVETATTAALVAVALALAAAG